MAFGGVATGNMKAKDALSVQGIITYRGFRLMDWDWIRTQKNNFQFMCFKYRNKTPPASPAATARAHDDRL